MIKFYAHRAKDNHGYNENSKNAIKCTLSKDYITGIELDIRLTKDKKVIVYHDAYINIKNKIKLINDTKYIELYKSEIYLLEEVLSFFTDKIIILEIKYENVIDNNDIDIFIKEFEKYNLNIYVCSFNRKLIKKIKRKYKGKCGIIKGCIVNRWTKDLDFRIVKFSYFLNINKKMTFVWNVNDYNKVIKLVKFNKEINIITDKAYLLSRINDSRQKH